MIELVYEGRPVPWARVRRGRTGTTYTPAKQREHRTRLAWAIKEAYRDFCEKWSKPGGDVGHYVCSLDVALTFDYKLNETRIHIKPTGSTRHRKKRPDIDNLVKQVLEAIADSGIVEDDAQIAVVTAEKVE